MEQEYKELKPGEMKLSPTDAEFVQVPDGEPLKMHVKNVKLVEGHKYQSTEPETKLVVNLELDEDIEGKGQQYTGWFTPSLNPKSNLAQLVVAIMGELKPVDPATDFPGMPLRVVLENREKDGAVKQYPKSFLKPSKDQAKVDVTTPTETVDEPTDEQLDSDNLIEQAAKVFEGK